MQQNRKRGLRCLQIVAFVLSAFVICSAQTTSSTIVSESPKNHAAQQDSDTLKALEVANIRLAAASETIKLLTDRLAAKDAVIEAKQGLIAVRDEQLALALSANKDRAGANVIDAFRVEACQQQLAEADAEIARLRNPGFLKSLFDVKSITGAVVGFGVGRATK